MRHSLYSGVDDYCDDVAVVVVDGGGDCVDDGSLDDFDV